MRLGMLMVFVLLTTAIAGCIQNEPIQYVPDSKPLEDQDSEPAPRPDQGGEPPAKPLPVPSEDLPEPEPNETVSPSLLEPHVIVAVPDSGINPYHEVFHRPNRKEHPCTYIQDYPCDIPALNLSIGKHDSYREAVLADLDLWKNFKPGEWYWIPRTAIVGIGCDLARDGESHTDGIPSLLCGLDENDDHGTGIASSILMENPDAFLVVYESHSQGHGGLDLSSVPIDIYSHSNGFNGPSPYVGPVGPMLDSFNSIYVRAAGNQPDTTFDKYYRSRPDVIVVGGVFPADRTVPVITTKNMDVASYFSRPGARSDSITELRPDFEGTSLAAPTVAGALSKVVLGLRQVSGYTGSMDGNFVDPGLGITYADLRNALNSTADYNAPAKYPNTWETSGNYAGFPLPIIEDEPWIQLGWGIYDGDVANQTLAVLLGKTRALEKEEVARTYQELQYELRRTLYE